MAPLHNLRIVGEKHIFPTPRADHPSLPLTFFDLIFFKFPPVQRLFFYKLVTGTADTELAKLKHSLALTLHHYYPLAGSLKQGSGSQEQPPQIVCSRHDYISFTIAESREELYDLSGDHARPASSLQPLLPDLNLYNGRQPVCAVQATVFPDAGIAIATTLHHAIADGSTYTNFMKHWAMTHAVGENAALSNLSLPFFDRGSVLHPTELTTLCLRHLKELEQNSSLQDWDLAAVPDLMLATFTFTREQLQKLQHRIATIRAAQCSPYAAATGFVWSGIARTRAAATSNRKEYFGFVTGCRPRTNPPLPCNYFGNCLGICKVEVEKSELVGEDGAVVAGDFIWKVIKKLEHETFKGAENWVRDVYDYASKRAVTVAGSPKLGIYDVNFGWGKPLKVEIVSIQRTGAMGLAESRDRQGGIEVGVALPEFEMKLFASYYVEGLSEL